MSHRNALESLGIPCFLGGMSRGMLGKNSPLHIRQNRRDALKDADLVLLAGGKQRQLLYSSNMCRICVVFISLYVLESLGILVNFKIGISRVRKDNKFNSKT